MGESKPTKVKPDLSIDQSRVTWGKLKRTLGNWKFATAASASTMVGRKFTEDKAKFSSAKMKRTFSESVFTFVKSQFTPAFSVPHPVKS